MSRPNHPGFFRVIPLEDPIQLHRMMRYSLAAAAVLYATALLANKPTPTAPPIGFEPNKGQFALVNGRPAPFILLKAEGKGLSTYITETGLSYVFTKRVTESPEEARAKGPKQRSFYRKEPKLVSAEMAWAHMRLEGADIRAENIVLDEEGTARYDYYLKHCPQGVTGMHRYRRATIREVYPGIDWVLYINEAGMKYDFVVRPGGDASRISMVYHSEEPMAMTSEGGLKLGTAFGDIKEQAPVAWLQDSKEVVRCRFGLTTLDKHRVRIRFELPAQREPDATLVIDPQLTWATFTHTDQLDGPMTMATKSNGDLIVAGYGGGGFGFPVPFDTLNFTGAYTEVLFGGFLQAFNSNGVLLWSTLYAGIDLPMQLHVDANDRILFAGTAKADFVTQPGSGSFTGAYYNSTFGGGTFESDAMIVGFTPGGQREWATYLGGGHITSLAADATGRMVLVGSADDGALLDQAGTGSFAGAFYQPTADLASYFLGFAANGTLEWASGFPSMYFQEKTVAFRPTGEFIVTGASNDSAPTLATGVFSGATQNAISGSSDGYIAGFASNGSQLWGSFFEMEDGSTIHGMDVGPDGRMVVLGHQNVTSFTPFANGVFAGAFQNSASGGDGDISLFGFAPSGQLQWATQLGGTTPEAVNTNQQVAMDACGNIHVAFEATAFGYTPNNPVMGGGCNGFFDGTYGDGDPVNSYGGELVLMRFTPNGGLTWSTYYGGPFEDFRCAVAVTPQGELYTAGESQGGGFPTLDPGNGAWYMDDATVSFDDSFILHFSPTSCESAGCTPFYATALGDPLLCPGDCNGTATANGINGTAPYTFLWDNGQTTATATGLCAGEHSVTVTDAGGNSETVTIVIVAPSAFDITLETNTSACDAATGSAIISFISGGTFNYDLGPWGYDVLWSTGDVDEDSLMNIGPGSYILTITDANGCSASDTAFIAQVSQPVAQATALDTLLSGDESTTLFATGGGTYLWTPATGLSCTTCQSPTAAPTDTTTYCVVVTDANQCTDTACVRILVEAPCGDVFVPTAFSPNASGKNDAQCVYGGCIATMSFTIYDRWGTKVFESTDPKICWDGTHNGKALNPAVFVYALTATLNNGETVSKNGNITLVR